jgi:pilus assembly protein CpaC
MFLNNVKSKLAGSCARTAAAALIALAAIPLNGLATSKAALATDLEAIESPESDAHFVRLGLNKSLVIKLPAEAKDVIVGNPAIVDAVVRTKNTAYLFARTYGQTNIFFFDKDGQQILAVDLEVTGDLTGLRKLLDRSLPGNRIKVDSINNKILLSGVAANTIEAQKALVLAGAFTSVGGQMDDNSFGHSTSGAGIINAMTIAGEDQVMLKVRVVEIQRSVLKQFGINIQALLSAGKFAFNFTSAPFASATSGIKGLYSDGTDSITGVLKAMEADGVLKTLAEPNLTAVSGESAKFQAGGEVPIKTCVGSLTTTAACSTTYKQFGVGLSFTPRVDSEGRIALRINTTVSNLGTADEDGNPSFDTRSAETTVELPSGGSMMMAGLIKDSTRQNISGMPGLRKLPVLGTLFRSRDFVQNQTELVVIVTPYLVGSTAEAQLNTPADNFNVPSDRQTYLFGHLNKIYGAPGKHPDGVYHGNVGFIVE